MAGSYGRHERVAAAIRREMAVLLQRRLRDPRLRGAVCSEVRVTADLKRAFIYVSLLDDAPAAREAAQRALRAATGFVRTQLAAALDLRYMPEVILTCDTLIADSMRLDALIARGLPPAPADPGES